MRLFIYEECEESVENLSKDCNLNPTKYINLLLKVLREDCHTELTEVINERIKERTRVREGHNKS